MDLQDLNVAVAEIRGKVILAVFIFLCRIDFTVDRLRNALNDLDAAHDVGVGAGQVGLHHVDAGGVVSLLQGLEGGQGDEMYL